MDLQTRKIEFIREFLLLQSEEIISKFEKLLRDEKKFIPHAEMEPMAMEEFKGRIKKSLEDSKAGRVTDWETLVSEIEQWK